VCDRKIKSIVAVVVVFFYVASPIVRLLAAPASGTPAPSSYARSVGMKPGKLSGKLLYTDQTPVVDAPVRVRTVAENKLVMETKTDAEGAYSLGHLDEGHYLIDFADRATVELRAGTKVTGAVETLDMVIPRGLWRKGGLLRTAVTSTGVGATAVALVVAVDSVQDPDNGDKKVVSP